MTASQEPPPGAGPAVPSSDHDVDALYEQAPCGYLSSTPEGRLVRVNETFLRLTGYRREDLLAGRRFVDLLSPGSRIYHETHFSPLLRMQDAVQEIALTLVTADGGRLPVLVNSRVLTHDDGTPRLVLTSVFDARDRRRYEQELLAARRRAEQATDELRQLQQFSADLASAADLAAVSAVVTRAGIQVVGAAAAVTWLREVDGHRLVPVAVRRSADDTGPATPPEPAGSLTLDGPDVEAALAALDLTALPAAAARQAWPRSVRLLAHGGAGGDRPDDDRPDDDRADDDRPDDRGTYVATPLHAAGRPLGAVVLRFVGDVSAARLELVRTLARQAEVAVARALLLEQQRDVARGLQRSLLPADLPADEAFELATVYRPAQRAPDVGGDWYDAFRLEGHRLAVVVGDVVGRGVNAAGVMGQLRSAIRALALVDAAPGVLLEHLDGFVDAVPAAACATVVYAVLDLNSGRLTYSCAGHPPPLLRLADGAVQALWDGRSVPLGIRLPGRRRGDAVVDLPAGSTLLLYTDGLVERRDTALDERIDELAEELAAAHAPTAGALLTELADTMLGSPTEVPDDVCVLSLTLTGRASATRVPSG